MLTKIGIETVVPPVEGVEGSPESTYCTAPPPDEEDGGGPTPPPQTAEGDDGDSDGSNPLACTLFVPNNPNDPTKGEVRTPSTLPAPAGYVCQSTTTSISFELGNVTGAGTEVIREIQCFWQYP